MPVLRTPYEPFSPRGPLKIIRRRLGGPFSPCGPQVENQWQTQDFASMKVYSDNKYV